ncbi:MAG: amino acid permease [Endomicrobium sp.]|jgi:L-asparagine transporter-like permease|nr:amino acid permease [Endomicrobium sp.]
MKQPQKSHLKRKLQNRHIQFIALGGAVGSGLFLGAGGAIFAAGPSVLLGYLISGIAIFLIMRQLGEMDTEEPMAGSFSYFAYKYWGDFPGFLAGWNYWILYVMIGIAELTAVAAYTQYWFPTLETWKTALFFFAIINTINLAAVKAYGETEFCFSIIKILAICAMILTGGYILFINPGLIDGASIKNLWMVATVGKHAGNTTFSGFFPHGFMGLITVIPIITFAFGGLELIGITAAETADPQKTIPKAVNQVVFRILIFYVGSLFILLSLYHWSNLRPIDSPFVMIFDRIGFKYAAWTLNFIILTAALSVYNSCIYSNSRMLYGLALQNNAPQFLTKTNKKGIPITSLLLSSILMLLVVPLNYFIPNWFDAFKIIMSFVVVCAIINWCMITTSHIKFKKQKKLENHKTLFPAPLYPYSNYITLIFYTFILVTMALPQLGMAKQVIVVPIWILIVYAGYKILKIKKNI